MPWTVFYSWQSDLPNKTNWSFIEDALERAARAVARDDTVTVEPVIDRDTSGLTGAPEITAAIFRKIEQAQVFVCDVSIIGNATPERPTPNPNVLIELGFALKTLGWERVIMVMNTAYGSIESLPFDLRTRRVVTYSFSEEVTEKAPVRTELVGKLERHIRAIIEMERLTLSVALSSPQKADQYARLRVSMSRGEWYAARELLEGLAGYRNVDDLATQIQGECDRVDSLLDEASDALQNSDPVKLIRVTRGLGTNIPPAINEEIENAWRALPFGKVQRLYQHVSNRGDVTPLSIALSTDGSYAFVGFADNHIKEFDIDAGRELRPSQRWVSEAQALAVMPDNKSIVTPIEGFNISRWDLQTGDRLGYFQLNKDYADYGNVSSIVVTPDGAKLLVGYEDGSIRMWTVNPIGLPCKFEGHDERVNTLVMLPNGRDFLSGSNDGTFRYWSLEQCDAPDYTYDKRAHVESAQRVFDGMKPGVKSLVVTPDGQRAISLSANRTLTQWNLTTRELGYSQGGSTAQCLAISPCGYEILVGTDSGAIAILDAKGGKFLRALSPERSRRHPMRGEVAVTVVAITPGGQKIVFATADGSVYLLEAPAGLFSP